MPAEKLHNTEVIAMSVTDTRLVTLAESGQAKVWSLEDGKSQGKATHSFKGPTLSTETIALLCDDPTFGQIVVATDKKIHGVLLKDKGKDDWRKLMTLNDKQTATRLVIGPPMKNGGPSVLVALSNGEVVLLPLGDGKDRVVLQDAAKSSWKPVANLCAVGSRVVVVAESGDLAVYSQEGALLHAMVLDDISWGPGQLLLNQITKDRFVLAVPDLFRLYQIGPSGKAAQAMEEPAFDVRWMATLPDSSLIVLLQGTQPVVINADAGKVVTFGQHPNFFAVGLATNRAVAFSTSHPTPSWL